MLQTDAASSPSSQASSVELGDLIRQVSEILAEEQAHSQGITDLCTLLAFAFRAMSVSILIEDAGRSHVEYRYDLPLGSVDNAQAYRMKTIPLQIGPQLVGMLSMTLRGRGELDKRDEAALEACARYLAVSLRNAILTDANGDLRRLVEVDALTEVGNRRRFDAAIATEWRRCGRNAKPLSVVMIDIDFFKEFNDRYGHVFGDACLQQTAQAISESTMRASDVVARYGGDEFAVVLPETDSPGAIAVAENIRNAVQRLRIAHDAGVTGSISISLGVATVTPTHEASPGSLVEAADRALYCAKASTRDRIFVASYSVQAPGQHLCDVAQF
jgi:diguanylate cyclase (GGDEF)-like protein